MINFKVNSITEELWIGNSGLVLVISHSTFGLILCWVLQYLFVLVCRTCKIWEIAMIAYFLQLLLQLTAHMVSVCLLTLFSTLVLNLFVTFCIFPVNEIWYALFCPPFQIWRMVFESNRNIVETPISQQSLLNRKIMLILARVVIFS